MRNIVKALLAVCFIFQPFFPGLANANKIQAVVAEVPKPEKISIDQIEEPDIIDSLSVIDGSASLEKSVDKPIASPGEILTYTIDNIQVTGSELLSNVTVTDQIPQGTTYLPGSAFPAVSELSGMLTWNLGSNTSGVPGTDEVSVDGAVTSWIADGVSSTTAPHTTGTGSDRLLLVGISFDDERFNNVSSVTFTPVGETSISLIQIGSALNLSANRGISIWSLLNPPSGITGNIQVNFGITVRSGIVIGAVNFSGVDQENPYGTFVSSTGDYTVPTVQLDSLLGSELVFDIIAHRWEPFAGTSQTRIWYNYKDVVDGAASIKQATASTETMNWQTSSLDFWAMGAVPLHPSLSRFSSLSTSHALVSSTESFVVQAEIRNSESDTNIAPGPLLSSLAGVACSAPNPPSGDIPAGGSLVFTYTCTAPAVSEVQNVTLSLGEAAGDNFTYPAATSNSILIVPSLSFQVSVDEPAEVEQVTNTAILDDASTDMDPTPSNTVTTSLASTLGNQVWLDTDLDGFRDSDEPGIDGVVVELVEAGADGIFGSPDDISNGTQTTATIEGIGAGHYRFTSLPNGLYRVSLAPSNFEPGGALDGLYPAFVWDDHMDEDSWNQALPYQLEITAATNFVSADFGFLSDSITPTQLTNFTARDGQDGINISWETVCETNIFGFNIYRALSAQPEKLKLNEDIISAYLPGSPFGGCYSYLDKSVVRGIKYDYWLELITLDFQSEFTDSPVAAFWGWKAYLPILRK